MMVLELGVKSLVLEVEATNANRKVAESLLEVVDFEVRVLREKVAPLEVQVDDDFLMNSDMPELHESCNAKEKKKVNSSKTSDGSGLSPNSITDKDSPPSASSSSSANQASERSRNGGLGKLFSRSISSSSHTENQ